MLYFVGGALSYIEADLGATVNGSWLPVSNTLAITGRVLNLQERLDIVLTHDSRCSLCRLSPGPLRTTNDYTHRFRSDNGWCGSNRKCSRLRPGRYWYGIKRCRSCRLRVDKSRGYQRHCKLARLPSLPFGEANNRRFLWPNVALPSRYW